MATVGRINVFLGADTAAFTSKLDRATRDLSKSSTRMNRSLAKIGRGFKSAGKSASLFAKSQLGLRSIIGIVAGGAGLGLLLKRSLDTADSIAKMADATGISTTAIQQYRFALDLAGVAQDQTDKGLIKFTRNMGELARSSSETQTALKDLDPALLANLRSLNSVEDQLALGFRALASYANQSKRAAVAAALFGRSGVLMTVAVKDGAAAFEDARQRALDLGIVLKGSLLDSAVGTKDALAEMTKQIDSNVTRAMLNLAPLITGLTGLFADLTSGIVAAGGALESAFAPNLQQQLDSLLAKRAALEAAEAAGPRTTLFDSSAKAPRGRRGSIAGAVSGPGTPQRRPGTGGVDPLAAIDRQIAKLKELIEVQKTAAAATPDAGGSPLVDQAAVDKLARQGLILQDDLTASIREEEAAARQRLDTIFSTIATNKERYEAEIDFIKKTRFELAASAQLTTRNQAILERGAEAARKRLEENNPALLEAKALLAGVATEEERLIALEKKLNALVEKGALTREQANKVLARTKDRMAEVTQSSRLLERGMDAIDSAIVGNMDTWQDWARVAISEMRRVINEILRNKDIFTFNPVMGSGGGILSSIFSLFSSKGVSPTGSDILGTPFVHGGRPAVGKVALVGERGPELFKPDVAGTIIPNSELGGGGGGVTNQFFVDNRGASVDAVKRLERFVHQMNASIERRAVGAVVEARFRRPRLFG